MTDSIKDKSKLPDFHEYVDRMKQELSEELLPELVPYLEQGSMGEQLRHPLLYQVPLINNGGANRLFKFKQESVEKALAEGLWRQYVWLHERPYRLDAFVEIVDKLSDRQYWELLSAIWTDTENSWQNLNVWRELFKSEREHKRFMMDELSYHVYKQMPEKVTVWRGCQRGVNEIGLSWTFDKDKAKFFAKRLDKPNPIVIQLTVDKEKVVAVFLDRNEQEVIITDYSVIDTWWDV